MPFKHTGWPTQRRRSWLTPTPRPNPLSIQLIAGDSAAVIEVGGGEVRSRVGRDPSPELTLEGPPRLVLGLLAGMIDLGGAIGSGLSVTGNTAVLDRLRRD